MVEVKAFLWRLQNCSHLPLQTWWCCRIGQHAVENFHNPWWWEAVLVGILLQACLLLPHECHLTTCHWKECADLDFSAPTLEPSIYIHFTSYSWCTSTILSLCFASTPHSCHCWIHFLDQRWCHGEYPWWRIAARDETHLKISDKYLKENVPFLSQCPFLTSRIFLPLSSMFLLSQNAQKLHLNGKLSVSVLAPLWLWQHSLFLSSFVHKSGPLSAISVAALFLTALFFSFVSEGG